MGLNRSELRILAQKEGQATYRGDQLADWIYRHGARQFEDMTNLPGAVRTKLAEKYYIGRSPIVTTQQSKDGTYKLLLEIHDGVTVEAVGLVLCRPLQLLPLYAGRLPYGLRVLRHKTQ